MEIENNSRTARDALIIELLGDVGLLHDEIKKLPGTLKNSLSDSMRLIALSVEESEKTAQQLKNETELAIKSMHENHMNDLEKESKFFLQETVMKTLNAEMTKTAELTQNIRNTLNSYPDAFRPRAPLGPLLALSALVMAAVIGSNYFSWKMYERNDELRRNVSQVYMIYEQQQKVIQTLPPEYRKKFKAD
ncbi:hypothetical protein [Erwinia amylovora]|uniref:ORF23 n=2 Tax=Erwinia amylovora TaxID=552 RepID=Q6TFQ5_ERWAM|nr:hypothetical protein [Erwinia amylovora]AAQ97965.1 ORF23 [Erwinia amylovora]UDJ88588.1 hypothetical protein IRM68_17965 [Erwinia amylovora]